MEEKETHTHHVHKTAPPAARHDVLKLKDENSSLKAKVPINNIYYLFCVAFKIVYY